MKPFHAENGDMVMYVKRLEAGRFKLPEYDLESACNPKEWRDFVMIVEGAFDKQQALNLSIQQ